jgi:hypothetical protein
MGTLICMVPEIIAGFGDVINRVIELRFGSASQEK